MLLMNMEVTIDGNNYEVVIIRKNNKNTYIRVKNDNKIYVTTNFLAPKRYIYNLINNNLDSIRKMLEKVNSDNEKKDIFFYLGKRYDIIVVPIIKKIQINEDNILTPSLKEFDKFLKKESMKVFKERYEYVLTYFKEDIIPPQIRVRTMKTRWGVYNKKNHTITLNTKLLSYSYLEIDYVIIHELSHIIHFDHSKNFWNLVSRYCPNYKQIKRKLKE